MAVSNERFKLYACNNYIIPYGIFNIVLISLYILILKNGTMQIRRLCSDLIIVKLLYLLGCKE